MDVFARNILNFPAIILGILYAITPLTLWKNNVPTQISTPSATPWRPFVLAVHWIHEKSHKTFSENANDESKTYAHLESQYDGSETEKLKILDAELLEAAEKHDDTWWINQGPGGPMSSKEYQNFFLKEEEDLGDLNLFDKEINEGIVEPKVTAVSRRKLLHHRLGKIKNSAEEKHVKVRIYLPAFKQVKYPEYLSNVAADDLSTQEYLHPLAQSPFDANPLVSHRLSYIVDSLKKNDENINTSENIIAAENDDYLIYPSDKYIEIDLEPNTPSWEIILEIFRLITSESLFVDTLAATGFSSAAGGADIVSLARARIQKHQFALRWSKISRGPVLRASQRWKNATQTKDHLALQKQAFISTGTNLIFSMNSLHLTSDMILSYFSLKIKEIINQAGQNSESLCWTDPMKANCTASGMSADTVYLELVPNKTKEVSNDLSMQMLWNGHWWMATNFLSQLQYLKTNFRVPNVINLKIFFWDSANSVELLGVPLSLTLGELTRTLLLIALELNNLSLGNMSKSEKEKFLNKSVSVFLLENDNEQLALSKTIESTFSDSYVIETEYPSTQGDLLLTLSRAKIFGFDELVRAFESEDYDDTKFIPISGVVEKISLYICTTDYFFQEAFDGDWKRPFCSPRRTTAYLSEKDDRTYTEYQQQYYESEWKKYTEAHGCGSQQFFPLKNNDKSDLRDGDPNNFNFSMADSKANFKRDTGPNNNDCRSIARDWQPEPPLPPKTSLPFCSATAVSVLSIPLNIDENQFLRQLSLAANLETAAASHFFVCMGPTSASCLPFDVNWSSKPKIKNYIIKGTDARGQPIQRLFQQPNIPFISSILLAIVQGNNIFALRRVSGMLPFDALKRAFMVPLTFHILHKFPNSLPALKHEYFNLIWPLSLWHYIMGLNTLGLERFRLNGPSIEAKKTENFEIFVNLPPRGKMSNIIRVVNVPSYYTIEEFICALGRRRMHLVGISCDKLWRFSTTCLINGHKRDELHLKQCLRPPKGLSVRSLNRIILETNALLYIFPHVQDTSFSTNFYAVTQQQASDSRVITFPPVEDLSVDTMQVTVEIEEGGSFSIVNVPTFTNTGSLMNGFAKALELEVIHYQLDQKFDKQGRKYQPIILLPTGMTPEALVLVDRIRNKVIPSNALVKNFQPIVSKHFNAGTCMLTKMHGNEEIKGPPNPYSVPSQTKSCKELNKLPYSPVLKIPVKKTHLEVLDGQHMQNNWIRLHLLYNYRPLDAPAFWNRTAGMRELTIVFDTSETVLSPLNAAQEAGEKVNEGSGSGDFHT